MNVCARKGIFDDYCDDPDVGRLDLVALGMEDRSAIACFTRFQTRNADRVSQ